MSSSVPSSTSIDDDQARRAKLASILDQDDAAAAASSRVSGGETYEQGLAAILDDDDDDDDESPSDQTNGKAPHTASDDEEEAFLYPGADHAANIFEGEAEESGPSSPRSYGARMASILGSSEGDGEAAQDGEGEDEEEEQFVYPNGGAHDDNADDSLPSALPDRTLDSIRSMADSQHPGFKWRRGSSMADLSMSTSTTMTDLGSTASRQRPARPPEYPTLSRLRSNATPSSLRGQRSGPFGGTMSGFLGFGRSTSTFDISRSSITHSRTASSSSSLMGAGRRGSRLFPYGVNTPPSELSLPSSRDATMAAATPAETSNPAAASSSLEPLTERGLFKWSALRKVAAFFQEGQRSGTSSVTASSGQSLPQDIGRQTVFAVAGGLVAIGTTTGHILVFEFSQDFKCICGGPGAGEVTSLAFSADHASLAAGYSRGHVYIYDLAKPTAPSRTVLPVSRQDVASGKKEGHFGDSKVVHVAFVGARHTAIFTADDQGLAFYHSLGKILGVASNDTLRILGRYPERGSAKRRAPILSLAALPLGPVDHLADGVHFVALVTPQKLVIVGLKPNARTWYRKSAPLNDGGGSGYGCAAWFPAFQDESSTGDNAPLVEPMLAYSFGTHLYVLRMKTKRVKVDPSQANGHGDAAPPQYRMDIEFIEHALPANSGGPDLRPIESIQWLSHELLLLVTSDDLRLVDLRVSKATEREQLGSTLSGLVRHPWSQDVAAPTRHSAHSVRVFRGKAFFLTTTQIVVGHLLAWTDRLLSLVSSGDFLSAIDLCRAYYLGQVPGSRVGLPDDDAQLREVVGGKLRELMSASARYAFAPERMTDGTHVTSDGRGVDRTQLFRDLARACAEACLALNDTTFLFGDLYDYYSDSGIEPLFVTELEPFILDGRLRQMPIPVTQRLVQSCKQAQDWGLAERLLWHVDPMCLDLDQALTLCREQGLVDASIYIYNAALSDFVSPIVELLDPVKKVVARRARGELDEHEGSDDEDGSAEDGALTSAYKLYSYLSVILSGRTFPSQDPLSPFSLADQAKRSVYGFIFSGHCVVWPPGAGAGGRIVLSVDEGEEERTYPYARLLLACDAEALLDALDVAFEDGFLDDEDDDNEVTLAAGSGDGATPRVTRQRIIDILLETAHDGQHQNGETSFASTPHTQDNLEEQRLFTSIFVARNLARYPQFVRLTPSTFDGVLRDLCLTGGDETREDRQLAAEALLSTRRPMKGKGAAAASPLAQLSEDELGMLEAAGFWRILKSAYRDVGNWGQLVALLLSGDEEDDGDDVRAEAEAGGSLFAQLTDVLGRAQRQQQQRNKGQSSLARSDLDSMIIEATPRLVELDASRTAQLVDAFFSDRHGDVLEVLSEQDESVDRDNDGDMARRRQLSYLRSFIEQDEEDATSLKASYLDASCRSTYLWLKARLEPWDLVRVLVARQQQQADGDYFDLNIVVEAGKHHGGGAYDAVLWSLDRLGKPKEAFDALDDFVAQTALLMRKEAVDAKGTEVQNGVQHHESATPSYNTDAGHGAPRNRMEQLADDLSRASRMAVQICDSSTSTGTAAKAETMSVEDKWYRLLRSMVALMHHVGGGGGATSGSAKRDSSASAALDVSRRIVEETLASMVTSLSTSSHSLNTNSAVSLPSLFRRLVSSSSDPTTTSSPQTFGEVRTIISAMMSACKLRSELLGVAQRLLSREEGDQFVLLARQRRRGWRGSSAGVAEGQEARPVTPTRRGMAARGREGSLTATATMMATPARARASSSLSSSGTPYAYHPAHRLASQPPTPGAGTTGMMTPLATPRAGGRIDRKGKARSLSFRHDEEEENGASRSMDDYFGPSASTTMSTTYRGSSGSPEQSFSIGSSPTALRGMARRRGGGGGVDEEAVVSSSPREWTTEGVVEAAPVAKAVRVRLGPAPTVRGGAM